MKRILLLISVAYMFTACMDTKNSTTEEVSKDEESTITETPEKTIDISSIKAQLCQTFPKDLIMSYNPDATHIEIESVDNGSGGVMHCKVKLFYGEKAYEFWEGQVTAWINQVEDPFFQYNPKRNATLYHDVEGIGDRAVYISNMFQLQILKDGVVYSITPPNRGRTTSTGKETKEIAIEIAKHYKI